VDEASVCAFRRLQIYKMLLIRKVINGLFACFYFANKVSGKKIKKWPFPGCVSKNQAWQINAKLPALMSKPE
jgi:hypothetical protein